ncbi:hypothetical protein AVEN_141390-1 [Araneus ventricosus]|uniref:Mos1 transposase HTH domain-containing protein n=1 Tax=Araneus ventricosus TaxID=182803 RepID=A0A4Y2D025_ARAVE|nr:hypothetical protein AVEN_141390-1 [Araneus ventricosus]
MAACSTLRHVTVILKGLTTLRVGACGDALCCTSFGNDKHPSTLAIAGRSKGEVPRRSSFLKGVQQRASRHALRFECVKKTEFDHSILNGNLKQIVVSIWIRRFGFAPEDLCLKQKSFVVDCKRV